MNPPDAIDLSYFVDGIFTNFEETFDVDQETLTEQRQEWITVAEMKQLILADWFRQQYNQGYTDGIKSTATLIRLELDDLEGRE